MVNIYKGVLRLAEVTKVRTEDGKPIQFEYVRPIVRKDLLFYEGVRKKPISFDYDTVIPEESEAVELIMQSLKSRPVESEKPYPKCSFVNYDEIEPYMTITHKEFRKMRKEYKEEHKRSR